MQFPILSTLLALAATTISTAIPSSDSKLSDLLVRDLPTEGNITFSTADFTTASAAKFSGGVEGTLEYRFINGNTVEARNTVTDTKGDSHSVFMTTVVYDGGDNVLRCQNNLGHGHSKTCEWRRYSRAKKVKGIAARWCVDIQGGGDDCLTGPRVGNPFA